MQVTDGCPLFMQYKDRISYDTPFLSGKCYLCDTHGFCICHDGWVSETGAGILMMFTDPEKIEKEGVISICQLRVECIVEALSEKDC